MRITPEIEAQYEENRLLMQKVNRDLHIYMWSGIILGALFFGSAFFISALSSLQNQKSGAGIFYDSFSAGFFQILFAILTAVLSMMTSMKKRIPSLILLTTYVVSLVLILLKRNGSFSSFNFLFLLVGIALNCWIQYVLNINEELKGQNGYPLFSVQADFRAQYEMPADVIARRAQASTHMAEIGGLSAAKPAEKPILMPQAAPLSSPAPLPLSSTASSAPSAFDPDPNLFSDPKPVKLPPEVKFSSVLGLSEMTEGDSQMHDLPKSDALSAPTDITLEAFSAQTAQPAQTGEPVSAAQPKISPESMLADMTALPSHATVRPKADMLPSPEEVRARMAAMKRAREEHHPEG